MISQNALTTGKLTGAITSCVALVFGLQAVSGRSDKQTSQREPQYEVRSAIPVYDLRNVKRAEPVYEVRSAIPVLPPQPTPSWSNDLRAITGYSGCLVGQGESIQSIAMKTGCPSPLLASYNRLTGPVSPGRMIIVPRTANAPQLLSKPGIIERGATHRPLVALTFDAGSTAEPLPKLLQTLRDNHLRVTFFVTGFWVRENPSLLQQIVAEGHELANHSLTHTDMCRQEDIRIKHELLETERLVKSVSGATTRPYFRPPYGAYNNRVLLAVEGNGWLPIYWTLDCLDSVGAKKSPAFIADRVTRKLTREQLCGAIILMHVDSMATADAVPTILQRFNDMGLQVVTVTKVLNEN